MLTKEKHQKYLQILREELVPAMGCTEPVAIAYAGAKARQVLGELPTVAKIELSGNVIKNVKSVVVPNTDGMRGIENALAAGIAVGSPDAKLQVVASVKHEDVVKIAEFKNNCEIIVRRSCSDAVFEIDVTLQTKDHSSRVKLLDSHTNIVLIEKDGETIYENQTFSAERKTDRGCLSVEDIYEFACTCDLEEIRPTLARQIEYNFAIAEEGLKNNYGANVGKVYLKSGANDIRSRAKAYAAAGSDARMNGCEMPVIINSGSGNQGITASVPVILYAREKGIDEERLYRALCISNLVTIHLKTGIGALSAYCGVVSAGAGAGAGLAYLLGGDLSTISHTIVNALAMDSGVICDGAKASCAAKIAIAVESGILGLEMYEQGNQFYAGDGIVKKGVEKTIHSISRLACEGMRSTDQEIINIMFSEE